MALIIPPAPNTKSPQKKKPRKEYTTWSAGDEGILLDWLETDDNYNKWRCAGYNSNNGRNKTTGKTKKEISKEIEDMFKTRGVTNRNATMIKDKITVLERSYKNASDWLDQTGEGLERKDKLAKDPIMGKQKS